MKNQLEQGNISVINGEQQSCLLLRFTYDPKIIDAVKSIPGRRYDRKMRVHTLRHSFDTHLLEHVTNLRYIQEILGHSSSKTTKIYTHISTQNIANIRSPLDEID